VEQLGYLRACDTVEMNLAICEQHYTRYLATSNNGENSLLKAVFRTYAQEICWQMVLNTVIAVLTFGSPFLVLKMITFITTPNRYPDLAPNCWQNIEWGVYYSLALVFSQLLAYLLQEHMFYKQIMTGYKCANMTNAIVYQKHANISNATNKEFTPGEVVNFVQVDTQQYIWMFV
jgi:hypothetical protein